MELEELRRRYFALIYVLSSALSGNAPSTELPASGIFSYAMRHSVGALAAHGLELCGIATEEARAHKLRAIRRVMLFDSARAKLLSRLDAEGIEYICLKGIVMKELYPTLGLREMSDNDILIPKKHRKTLFNIMTDLGYHAESYGKGHHDVYTKDPIYNFEIHISLFGSKHEHLHNYFATFLDRADRVSDSSLEKRMSADDFYIYMKAHEYKHYTNGGTGIRALVDTYIYKEKMKNALNANYIAAECDKIGITKYEELFSSLSEKLFSPERAESLIAYSRGVGELDLTPDELDMFDYIVSSGTYGKVSTEIENAMKRLESRGAKGAKLRFLLRRVFPPMSFYEENAPTVYKFKILIPFYCIGRLIGALFRQPRRIFAQLRSLAKYKKNKEK